MFHRNSARVPLFPLILFVFGFLCLSLDAVALDRELDLTGEWQGDNGTRYFLRQVGSELFWSMDGRPRVTNIFVGRIEGGAITGRWIDVPGGQLLNSGTLILRIESPNRLVKVSSSVSYGESILTRVGTQASPPTTPPPPATATTATWGTQADPWRGKNGQQQTLLCPAGGPAGGRLWGTDVYTDDSSICLAAVHAGVITASAGGTVTIEIRPGQPAYTGSTRNGLTSQGYGSWHGSFVFVGGAPAPVPPPPPTPAPPVAAPPAPPPAPPAASATWADQADKWRGKNGQQQTLSCPPGGPTGGRLWGTDVYTDDSSICLAAVHAGLITAAAGGMVTIEIRPGQPSYVGSTRYGVASQGYASWYGSFVFVGAVPGGGQAGGICDDPKTLAVMDEWLSRALPPQQPGESLRYEAWGRLVGRSKSATITVSGPPDTRLSRCEYLWQNAALLQSTNLGTLRDYVTSRR